jgi:hypothetical protein
MPEEETSTTENEEETTTSQEEEETEETTEANESEETAFDEDKAKAKIAKANREAANLRKRLKELEPKAKKADELENEKKSESERLTEAKTKLEREASEAKQDAMRMRVALKKGLSETQAKRLVGETEEDLEADADELLDSFKPKEDDETQEDESTKKKPSRPRERLKPGTAPSAEPDETDPAKLAAAVSRDY